MVAKKVAANSTTRTKGNHAGVGIQDAKEEQRANSSTSPKMNGAKTILTTLRARTTKKKTNAKQRQAKKEYNQTRGQITAQKQLANFTIQVKDAQKETSALSCILIKALHKKADTGGAPKMTSAKIRHTTTPKMNESPPT